MLGGQQWIADVVAPPSVAVWPTWDAACQQHRWPVCNSRRGTAEPCHADICAWWHQAYTLLYPPHRANVSHHARYESGRGRTFLFHWRPAQVSVFSVSVCLSVCQCFRYSVNVYLYFMSVLYVLCVIYYGPSEINDDYDDNNNKWNNFGWISSWRNSLENEPRSTVWERICYPRSEVFIRSKTTLALDFWAFYYREYF